MILICKKSLTHASSAINEWPLRSSARIVPVNAKQGKILWNKAVPLQPYTVNKHETILGVIRKTFERNYCKRAAFQASLFDAYHDPCQADVALICNISDKASVVAAWGVYRSVSMQFVEFFFFFIFFFAKHARYSNPVVSFGRGRKEMEKGRK